MDAMLVINFILFILVAAILIYFISDYIGAKKDVNKLMSLNKEMIDGVNSISNDYKNLLDILEVQKVFIKYKDKYKKIQREFKAYKLLEDHYEKTIKNKSIKNRTKKVVNLLSK